jgi:hypothetical protein
MTGDIMLAVLFFTGAFAMWGYTIWLNLRDK